MIGSQYEINERREIRIGVDLGGTKIEAIALDRAGEIRFRARVPTPSGDYDGTIRAIRDLVSRRRRPTTPASASAFPARSRRPPAW